MAKKSTAYFATVPPRTSFKMRFEPESKDKGGREKARAVIIRDTPTAVSETQAEFIREQIESEFDTLHKYVREVDMKPATKAKATAAKAETKAKADAKADASDK